MVYKDYLFFRSERMPGTKNRPSRFRIGSAAHAILRYEKAVKSVNANSGRGPEQAPSRRIVGISRGTVATSSLEDPGPLLPGTVT
jgi:hypothetical protein